jgi:hypothetical protein
MPLLILGVGITEPLPTRRAAYGRRVVTGRIAKRDALAQPLQVRALIFLFFHPHDIPRVAILLPLVCLPENLDDETSPVVGDSAAVNELCAREAPRNPIRSQTYLGAQYRHLRSKLGAPKTITAMAHRLARPLSAGSLLRLSR